MYNKLVAYVIDTRNYIAQLNVATYFDQLYGHPQAT